jgi:hypothetical protein
MNPWIPERLRAAVLAEQPTLDPELTWDELLAAVTAVVEADLEPDEREGVLRVLDVNLPGGRLRELLDWPGEWFGNRWMEEIALNPEEVSFYTLARSGRELPGVPADPELPFPVPEGLA